MTTGSVLLVLDGTVVAAPRSVAGGNTVADVVHKGGGGAHFAYKNLGATRVEELAYLTVKLAPLRVASGPAAGKLAVPQLRRGQWVASRYRLELDGLDTTRVSRIDPFAIRAAFDEGAEPRNPEVDLGALAFPNLRVTLPPNRARTWHEWFESFVVEGRHAHEHERNGTLTFLSADLTHVLTEVRLFGLGIFGLAPDAAGSIVADMYCQRIELGSVRVD